MTNRIEEKLKEFDDEFRDKLIDDARRSLMALGDYDRMTAGSYAIREVHEIRTFIEKALIDLIKELEDKIVGEKWICKECGSDGTCEDCIDSPKNGYNQKRNEVKQAFKEFNLKV